MSCSSRWQLLMSFVCLPKILSSLSSHKEKNLSRWQFRDCKCAALFGRIHHSCMFIWLYLQRIAPDKGFLPSNSGMKASLTIIASGDWTTRGDSSLWLLINIYEKWFHINTCSPVALKKSNVPWWHVHDSVCTNDWGLHCVTMQSMVFVMWSLTSTVCSEDLWGASFTNWLLHVALNIWNFLLETPSEQGKPTMENQFKLISEMRCFCLLL